jgi:hypothetical protein
MQKSKIIINYIYYYKCIILNKNVENYVMLIGDNTGSLSKLPLGVNFHLSSPQI